MQGLDAFTEGMDSSADHRFAILFYPMGNEEAVAIEVRAGPRGKTRLTALAAAAFPVSRQEAQTFGFRGALPAGHPRTTPEDRRVALAQRREAAARRYR